MIPTLWYWLLGAPIIIAVVDYFMTPNPVRGDHRAAATNYR